MLQNFTVSSAICKSWQYVCSWFTKNTAGVGNAVLWIPELTAQNYWRVHLRPWRKYTFVVSFVQTPIGARIVVRDTSEIQNNMFIYLLNSNVFYYVCLFGLTFLVCLKSFAKYTSGKIRPVKISESKGRRQMQRGRNFMDIHETKLPPEQPIPRSVNYHFTRKCNYECGFCFHTAKTSYMLNIEDAKRGLLMLKNTGKCSFIFSWLLYNYFYWRAMRAVWDSHVRIKLICAFHISNNL